MPSRAGDNSDCKDLIKYQLPRVSAIAPASPKAPTVGALPPIRQTDMSLYALIRGAGLPVRRFDPSLKNKVLIPSSRGNLTIEV